MDIILVIPGEPMAKARPRWARWGIYTPQKTVNFETQIKERFAAEYPNFQPLESILRLEIHAYQGIPLSKSKKKQALMERGEIRPKKSPENDNIEKIVFDALMGLAYRNDNQIVENETKKWYSRVPRLEISIREINEEGGKDE